MSIEKLKRLAKDAESVPWERLCARMERENPAIVDFLETWGRSCGASRATFCGHVCRMLIEIAKSEDEDEEDIPW